MANELTVSYPVASSSVYAIIRRQSDAYVWNGSGFVSWDDDDIATYDIPLTDLGGDLYGADFPTAIGVGQYLTFFYLQAGGSPSITDVLLTRKWQTWTGASLEDPGEIALSSYALCSLAEAKRYMHITSTDHDSLITELINAISAKIESIAGRKFKARDLVEWTRVYDGVVIVRNWPIISVSRVARSGGSAAITASYSGDDIRASISVTDSSVKLLSIASGGTATTSTLSYSVYGTTSTLAAAIAGVTGWSATANYDVPSSTLLPTSGCEVKGSDSTSTAYLYYASDAITWDDVTYETGVIRIPLSSGLICVEYRGGFETIPYDLNMLCRELVSAAFSASRKDLSVTSESLGDYAYTLASSVDMTARQEEPIRKWSEITV